MVRPSLAAASASAIASRSGARQLLVTAMLGYTVGTLPSADAVTRLATGGQGDLRSMGTGNPGAANALVALGKGWGYGIMAADIVKGASACLLGRRLAGDSGAHLGGTAAVVGHCYPLWNGFRGGKGVAVSVGQCLATFPVYVPIDLAVAGLTVAGRWRSRTFVTTAVASTAWVVVAWLWWRRGWRNGWGPRPSGALPASAATTTAVILSRFARHRTGRGGVPAQPRRF